MTDTNIENNTTTTVETNTQNNGTITHLLNNNVVKTELNNIKVFYKDGEYWEIIKAVLFLMFPLLAFYVPLILIGIRKGNSTLQIVVALFYTTLFMIVIVTLIYIVYWLWNMVINNKTKVE